MEILYISSVPSPKEFDRIKGRFKDAFIYGMNESGFKFHTLIMNGMISRPDVHITSLVGRSVSHSSHRGLWWKRLREPVSQQLVYDHIGFLNLPVVKHLMIGTGFFVRTLQWLHRTKGQQRAIVMDAAYVTAHPFVLAARKFGKCHTTAIFCDIYDYMGDVKDARDAQQVSLGRRMLRNMAGRSYRQLDSFILLTEQMTNVVNPLHKPYLVMEGLVDVNMESVPNELQNKTPYKTLMYAGALRAQYGLKNLVEGFQAYENPEARLWIFGAGDYAEEIEKAARQDPRITFGGMIPLHEAVAKELEADLLVNCRPTDMEFAQYSFPSKNMEYMASGTPVLTTRLPGMPQEYYQYVYTIDGNRPEDATDAIRRAMEYSKEELYEKGKKSRNFVLSQKNNITQSGRILQLVGYHTEQEV